MLIASLFPNYEISGENSILENPEVNLLVKKSSIRFTEMIVRTFASNHKLNH